jgi:hypothetical protein
MTDANVSKPVPCRDIDPADLFEQGLAPGAYHDLQEVAQELILDRSSCKIVSSKRNARIVLRGFPAFGFAATVRS